jgi:hypothetical protein
MLFLVWVCTKSFEGQLTLSYFSQQKIAYVLQFILIGIYRLICYLCLIQEKITIRICPLNHCSYDHNIPQTENIYHYF